MYLTSDVIFIDMRRADYLRSNLPNNLDTNSQRPSVGSRERTLRHNVRAVTPAHF